MAASRRIPPGGVALPLLHAADVRPHPKLRPLPPRRHPAVPPERTRQHGEPSAVDVIDEGDDYNSIYSNNGNSRPAITEGSPPAVASLYHTHHRDLTATPSCNYGKLNRRQNLCTTEIRVTRSRCCCWVLSVVLVNIALTALSVYFTIEKFNNDTRRKPLTHGDISNNNNNDLSVNGFERCLSHTSPLSRGLAAVDDRTDASQRQPAASAVRQPGQSQPTSETSGQRNSNVGVLNIFQQIIEKSFNNTIQEFMKTTQSLCAAHLYLNQHVSTGSSNDTIPVVGWTTEPRWAFMRSSCMMHDSDGWIKLNRAGLYVVYSHLAVMNTGKCGNPTCPFRQLVRKRSHNTARLSESAEVLSDTRLVSDALDNREPSYTSVIIGVVQLSRDDQLRVEVSAQAKLTWINRASYWGLFQLVT